MRRTRSTLRWTRASRTVPVSVYSWGGESVESGVGRLCFPARVSRDNIRVMAEPDSSLACPVMDSGRQNGSGFSHGPSGPPSACTPQPGACSDLRGDVPHAICRAQPWRVFWAVRNRVGVYSCDVHSVLSGDAVLYDVDVATAHYAHAR